MRKSQILKAIEGELQKSGKTENKLAEIRLTPLEPHRNKNRLAYCILTGTHTAQNVEDIIRVSVKEKFTLEVVSFANIEAAKLAHQQTMNDSTIIENNWRGRLFSFEQLQPLTGNNDELTKFLLRSIWRIIVQRDAALNYYVRHDIFPYFWSPGHSTGGKPDYIESIKNEFWSVAEPKFHRQDLDFDLIKVFGKKEDGTSTFPPIAFSPLGAAVGQQLYEIKFSMDHNKKKECLTNLLSQLDNFFRS
jgi:hypothetical protein